jgi:hypothetical protein
MLLGTKHRPVQPSLACTDSVKSDMGQVVHLALFGYRKKWEAHVGVKGCMDMYVGTLEHMLEDAIKAIPASTRVDARLLRARLSLSRWPPTT